MNIETLDETMENRTTRRRIVTTGAKLAYAAPLVAVSFKVSARGASAITPVGCFHSLGGDTGEGCMGACASDAGAGCTGQQCDGFGGPPGPCEDCNISPGNECPSTAYCNPDCFVCDPAGEQASFVC